MTLRNDELSLIFNESDIINDMTKKSLFLYTHLTKGTNDVIVTIMNKKNAPLDQLQTVKMPFSSAKCK